MIPYEASAGFGWLKNAFQALVQNYVLLKFFPDEGRFREILSWNETLGLSSSVWIATKRNTPHEGALRKSV